MEVKIAPTAPADASEGRRALTIGAIAAILASTCCLGPLILLMVGVSGAWIGRLTLLEPYRPLFLGVAVLSLVLAGRRIFAPPTRCAPGEVCALPATRRWYRILFVVVAVLVLIGFAYPVVAPYFY